MDLPEPEPKTQLLMRHHDERGGLSSSIHLEVEDDHGSGQSPADKVNGKDVAQLDDSFLEDPEAWTVLHQTAKMNWAHLLFAQRRYKLLKRTPRMML
ncbi:hypothetical protein KIL84_016506 [Mauremys mutica]|uniref:Uncharacterized protein n=1 Tax=Mauremys mutica TaxID=74926 RepID=A0A9D3X4K7_9SAUR|nr:hypothetical protein KIL84_016506 [Mauremys mutica]